jgi:hypothetical protein
MGIVLMDQNGWVSDLSSAWGLSQVMEWLEKNDKTDSKLYNLLGEWEPSEPAAVAEECTMFLKLKPPSDIGDILRVMQGALLRSQGAVYLE